MRKHLTLIMILISLIIACFLSPVHAQDHAFITKDYSVTMTVNDDFSFDITEDISVEFLEPRRGIFRSIPLSGNYYFYDEEGAFKFISFYGKISNVQANEKMKTETESGIYNIRLGDKDVTITGDKDYRIQYKWHSSDDTNDQMDWLYFNIIPQFWKSPIEGGKLTIHMPKDFDTSKIFFPAGQYGESFSDKVDFHVNGKTIYATIIEPLDVDEGITVYIPLPEGYYSQMPSIKKWDPLLIGGTLLTTALGLFLWFSRRYNQKPVQPVTYNPPEDLNPGTIGGIYKGEVDKKKMVVANMIHLANKGYLALEEGEKKGFIHKKNTMDLVFLKNMSNEEDPVAAHIYKGLFKGRKKYLKNGKTETDNLFFTNTANLSSNLYKDIDAAELKISNFLEKRIFKYENHYAFYVGVLMSLNCLLMALFVVLQQYALNLIDIIATTFWIGIYTLPILAMGIKRKNKIKSLILYLIGSYLLFSIFHFTFKDLVHYPIYFNFPFFLNILLGTGIVRYPRRSEEGNRLYGEVLGFKKFIETAEKDRLEMLVEENPQYFYDILPYAYILNVTDKWAKRFEGIAIEPPNWQVDTTGDIFDKGDMYRAAYVAGSFRSNDFIREFEDNMRSVAADIKTAAPSSDGGGFSGGGSGGSGGGGGSSSGGSFSGGGSGGGGGGSW